MLEAMGINLLTRYNATPTTINAITRLIKGISFTPQYQEGAIRCPILGLREGLPSKAVQSARNPLRRPACPMCRYHALTRARHMTKSGQLAGSCAAEKSRRPVVIIAAMLCA
jgi:hypothetical protein